MKKLLTGLLFIAKVSHAQEPKCKNIFIITTDGYRWEELFNGADSSLLSIPNMLPTQALTATNIGQLN
ncbi:MAG TPA: hypothetical protein VKH37_09630 [Ferruginibacter sp.]|nr:hypothetical protein [Ferruginibacter sp.]